MHITLVATGVFAVNLIYLISIRQTVYHAGSYRCLCCTTDLFNAIKHRVYLAGSYRCSGCKSGWFHHYRAKEVTAYPGFLLQMRALNSNSNFKTVSYLKLNFRNTETNIYTAATSILKFYILLLSFFSFLIISIINDILHNLLNLHIYKHNCIFPDKNWN